MLKKRILVVDDEPAFTSLLKASLERSGLYEVKEENRGEQAVTTALTYRPNLVLLDIVMPDMDGSIVASQFKENPDLMHVPIVFLTGIMDRQETRDGPVKIGGSLFIAKPVDLTKLLGYVNRLLAE